MVPKERAPAPRFLRGTYCWTGGLREPETGFGLWPGDVVGPGVLAVADALGAGPGVVVIVTAVGGADGVGAAVGVTGGCAASTVVADIGGDGSLVTVGLLNILKPPNASAPMMPNGTRGASTKSPAFDFGFSAAASAETPMPVCAAPLAEA